REGQSQERAQDPPEGPRRVSRERGLHGSLLPCSIRLGHVAQLGPLHLLHLSTGLLETAGVPDLADPGPDVLLLFADVALERRLDLLELLEPDGFLAVHPLQLLDQSLDLLNLLVVPLVPARQRPGLALRIARDRPVQTRLLDLLVQGKLRL